MTDAMEACPYEKRGQHALSVIVPDTSDLPATLFCERCGMTKAIALTFPLRADDVIAQVERYIKQE